MSDPLDHVRRICLALPEATENTEHRPVFKVRDKTFAWYMDDHHGDGRLALWLKGAPGAQAALVAEDPERFFVPPYVGPNGWVGVRLDRGAVDWDEIRELIEDSYRLLAPRRLVALLAGR